MPAERSVGAVMKDHEYFVYIVCSRSGTLYIGMTNSIYRRTLQHKSGEIEGFASMYHGERKWPSQENRSRADKKPCHPERSGCYAKRSSHEVEGPLFCLAPRWN